MLRCFLMLQSFRGRLALSLLFLASFPLVCLGGLSLYEGIDQPLEQIELVSNPAQQGIQQNIMDALPSLEHHFKENAGQLTNPAVRYYYSQADFGVAFMDTGVMYRLTGDSSAIVTLTFEGSNPVQPEGQQKYAHLNQYFQGNDPAQWVTGVRSYARIMYPELYEGIDLVYYFTTEGLKYDLVLQPGADPSVIRFRYEGIEYLTLDADGALTAHTAAEPLRDQALYMYQDTPAGRQPVAGAFTLYDGSTFGFQIMETYSSLYPLIVDPLVWSKLLGGAGIDRSWRITGDSENNVYITGVTENWDFPTTAGAYDETHNGDRDAFVCKFRADGHKFYSTFLGGSGSDEGQGIAVDSTNNVYVTGWTSSTDFPTTPGAINGTHNGGSDVFVCKLSADGINLRYSTLLGGPGNNYGWGIALDSANNIYVTGGGTADFPTTPGAFNETYNGKSDFFVCKISASGSSLLYSTFLGGSENEESKGIAVDSMNNVYVTGWTESTDFPTTPGAINETHNGGPDGPNFAYDVFVCKLSADGSNLLYSTFLGGSGEDYGEGIAVDSANNVCVTGTTANAATDFPTTAGAYDETHNGGSEGSPYSYDVFVCKLSADGSNLLYSTFLGGSDRDWGQALAVDSANNVYVTGFTVDAPTDFPTTSGAINETHNGDIDTFICKLSADGSSLLYSTFIGGSETEESKGIAVDSMNNVYITGYTWDAGKQDVFVCKIAFMPPAISLTSPVNGSIYQAGTTIDLSIEGIDSSVSHVLYNWDGGTNTTLTAPYALTLPSSEEQHILRVYANDTLGNWASQTYVFTTGEPTSTTTPTSTPGLELLTVLATICLLVLLARKKRQLPTN